MCSVSKPLGLSVSERMIFLDYLMRLIALCLVASSPSIQVTVFAYRTEQISPSLTLPELRPHL